ncbi:MAG: hypothetical protein QXJ97_08930 [Desulfurococcaceae archaeon]
MRALKPLTAAFYIATSYTLIVVTLLALLYFVIASLLHAFATMIPVALCIIAYMFFYTSVLRDRKYRRKLL